MSYENATAEQLAIIENTKKLCSQFSAEYWRKHDMEGKFPTKFRDALAEAGLLGVMMPPEIGGSGLGLTEAAMIIQTIVESGAGLSGATVMTSYAFASSSVVKHGNAEQKKKLIPLLQGKTRVAFAVTEPNTGLDTTRLKTRAVLTGDHYVVHGQKIWITGATMANKLLLIARTTPIEKTGDKPARGLSLFFTDFDKDAIEVRSIPKMATSMLPSCELFIDNLKIPKEDLIGEEGKGFYYLLNSLNPERVIIAAEAISLGKLALEKAVQYAKERIVFDRPIGMNQGIQHPLAINWAELEAAQAILMRAARMYDNGEDAGAYANAAKYLGAEAGFKACSTAIMTHGGMGYAKEFDVERHLREVMLPRLAPVSQQLILCYIAEKILGLPKSY